MRKFSRVDQLIKQIDQAINLCSQTAPPSATRENPANRFMESKLSPAEIKHTIGLMRVNHAGEIAAQGLYQGQALTAKLDDIREHMEQAALEEIDHLTWCRERLQELGGRTSYLDFAWYLGSVMIGATAGIAGDRWSLGFIAETEKQVSAHLASHLNQLNPDDHKTSSILQQMKWDEEQHEANALTAGGATLPTAIKMLMRLASKIMVKTAYLF